MENKKFNGWKLEEEKFFPLIIVFCCEKSSKRESYEVKIKQEKKVWGNFKANLILFVILSKFEKLLIFLNHEEKAFSPF